MVGLRDQINQKPAIAGGVVAALVLVVIGIIYFQLKPHGRPPAISGIQMYYTTDDGHTWFADAWEKIPPFDHDGVQAVRCYLFKTSHTPPFVGYLESYTPAMHDELSGTVHSIGPVIPATGTIVKRPSDKNWVLLGTPAGQKIVQVMSPDGPLDPLQPVMP